MGFGRFVCVAMPFGLSMASLVCILIVMLSGITQHNLDMFEVKTQNLSISSSSLANIEKELKRDLNGLTSTALENSAGSNTNFTASQLGLADSYKVFLWNYCSTTGTKQNCTSAKFNWASSSLNTTELNEKAAAIGSAAGLTNLTFPKDVTNSLKTFAVVSKWTEVAYIIAFVFTVLELVVGLFGFCSRAGSCVTYLISGLSTSFIIVASILATVGSAVVVAAVQTTARAYGAHADIQTGFLSVTWLAVAFSVGASLFWLFSVCCCKSEHRNGKRQSEKFAPGNYQQLQDPNTAYMGQTQGVYNNQPHKTQTPIRGGAYEPYNHSAV